MKKLLLCSTAAVIGLALATPAKADGVKMDLAGHFKGYVAWINQDTDPAPGEPTERHFDILRETEIHFTGETTLDNGLTVGVHHEADIDSGAGAPDFFATEESYAYFSGAWGRVNFGKEDGANYLLQVAAPSADENFDGLRQYVNPFNGALTQLGNAGGAAVAVGLPIGDFTRGFGNTGKLDYANDATGYANKLTYLTPVWSGFQAGFSYTPDLGGFLQLGGSPGVGSRAFGVNSNDVAGSYGSAWDAAARYEGQWQNVGLTAGAGYTRATLEKDVVAVAGTSHIDDFNQWNAGLNLNWGAFNLGGVYTKDNGGLSDNGENRTWVVGLDWTTGPFKIGGSYLNNSENLGTIATVDQDSIDTNRWAGGVVYTYGPGMTFRGSVGWTKSSAPDGSGFEDVKATDVLLGTQINF
jgi:outer membrane protein OmpU